MKAAVQERKIMKAYVLYGIGDFRYEETDKPVPGADEVLVRVKNVGICGSDVPRVYKTGMYSYPLSPGHEFAGVVEEAGAEQAAGDLQKQDRQTCRCISSDPLWELPDVQGKEI